MNFISCFGQKMNTEEYLNNIKNLYANPKLLYFNIPFLNTSSASKIIESKPITSWPQNSIKIKMNSKGTKSFSIKLPNLFGNGEYLNADASNLQNINVKFGFFRNSVYNTEIALKREEKLINEKEIQISKGELALKSENKNIKIGLEQIKNLKTFFIQNCYNLLGVDTNIKFGYTKSDQIIPFFKIILSKKLRFVGSRFFFENEVKSGKIFGHTHIIEKFFIGENLPGYKDLSVGPINKNMKIGGNSFIEIKNKFGFFVKNLKIFSFADVGVNSIKGIKECAEILAKFEDNNCIGKSVGLGISLKNKKGPSFIFSIPLTSNPECEKYNFGVDFEF